MDLENLSQFNKRLFKKFLGIYINQRRTDLKVSVDELASAVEVSVKQIKLIESGKGILNQPLFDRLFYFLELDTNEVINIGKLTQVQHIMDVSREINEHYPR